MCTGDTRHLSWISENSISCERQETERELSFSEEISDQGSREF